MKQEVYFETGVIHSLGDVLRRKSPENIFLVTGKTSYTSSGAEAILTKLLQPYQVHRFCEFESNPKVRDVERGLAQFQQRKQDVIIAVGGGGVIDLAKLIRIVAAQTAPSLDAILQSESILMPGVPLIVIPTTAGSGSEATHFAVVYKDHVKYSVAHEYVLPDVSFIDPNLTNSMSARLTAVTGMDALSQAVESYWCVNSTDCSKSYAAEAICLILSNLEKAVREPSSDERYAMCKASHLAGRAIDISKTTAPHAVSYSLTSFLDVPHGHAVSLTLGEFFVYNSQVSEGDVMDSRGADYVRGAMGDLNKLLGVDHASAARTLLSNLMRKIGLETRLSELGISKDGHDLILDNVNIERLLNNPRRLTREHLDALLNNIA